MTYGIEARTVTKETIHQLAQRVMEGTKLGIKLNIDDPFFKEEGSADNQPMGLPHQ